MERASLRLNAGTEAQNVGTTGCSPVATNSGQPSLGGVAEMIPGALRQGQGNLLLGFGQHLGLGFEMKALAILKTCRGTKNPAHEGERSDGREGAGSEQQQGPDIHDTYYDTSPLALDPKPESIAVF